jgi:hypothetical protein
MKLYHHSPQHAFMAWCPVKAQGQIYIFFKKASPNKHAQIHTYRIKNTAQKIPQRRLKKMRKESKE